MKYALLAIGMAFMVACGDGTNDYDNDQNLEDPSRVHPPEQAIPDSMDIRNDSLIMHDSTGHSGQ